MTRTARASYPRAVTKDRESRTGLDSSIRKSGAGHHNWGSLADELRLEEAAIGDEEMEAEIPVPATLVDSDSSIRSVSPLRQTEEEVEIARNFRKNAFKGGDIDLTAIARTSSAVLTPSPVSPVAARDGHDNKQIPIHCA